jgi:hypothetical protein
MTRASGRSHRGRVRAPSAWFKVAVMPVGAARSHPGPTGDCHGAVRSRDDLHPESLVAEQRALRRVATLVAERAAAEALFAVVAEQVAEVLSHGRVHRCDASL